MAQVEPASLLRRESQNSHVIGEALGASNNSVGYEPSKIVNLDHRLLQPRGRPFLL